MYWNTTYTFGKEEVTSSSLVNSSPLKTNKLTQEKDQETDSLFPNVNIGNTSKYLKTPQKDVDNEDYSTTTMPSVFLYLRKNSEQNGKMLVYARATFSGRRQVTIPMGMRVSELDSKSRTIPGDKQLTQVLRMRVNAMERACYTIAFDVWRYTDSQLHRMISNIMEGRPAEDIDVEFFPIYDKYAKSVDSKSTLSNYKNTKKHMLAFDKNVRYFNDISVEWCERFRAYLIKEKNLKTNSVYAIFRCIKAVVNDAIRHRYVVNYYNPFQAFRVTQDLHTKHRDLTIAELRDIRDTIDPQRQKHIDLFMLSFYLCGMNMVDLLNLKKDQYKNGHIEFRRHKTNGEYLCLPVFPEAKVIIDRYASKVKESEYLLDIHDTCKNYKDYLKHINQGLQKIGEKIPYRKLERNADGHGVYVTRTKYIPKYPFLTTYYARHTFATIASEECELPLDLVGRLMGHSQKAVTSIYVHISQKRIDESVRKVLDAIS